ncbi:alpha-2,8-sialyltransferase 8E-like [Glandiceps talaboti]
MLLLGSFKRLKGHKALFAFVVFLTLALIIPVMQFISRDVIYKSEIDPNVLWTVTRILNSSWTFNATGADEFRSLLHHLQTSEKFLMTQKNAVQGQTFQYLTNEETFEITPDMYRRFPQEMPLPTTTLFNKCSIVGNGAILRDSNCGKSIDSADFVLRQVVQASRVHVTEHLNTHNIPVH